MAQTSATRSGLLNTPIPDDRAEHLIAQHIYQDPRHPGRHEAQIETASSRPRIWALIRYLQAADAAEVAAAYDLSPEEIEAVVAYYQRHRGLIDAKVLLEDEEWAAS